MAHNVGQVKTEPGDLERHLRAEVIHQCATGAIVRIENRCEELLGPFRCELQKGHTERCKFDSPARSDTAALLKLWRSVRIESTHNDMCKFADFVAQHRVAELTARLETLRKILTPPGGFPKSSGVGMTCRCSEEEYQGLLAALAMRTDTR